MATCRPSMLLPTNGAHVGQGRKSCLTPRDHYDFDEDASLDLDDDSRREEADSDEDTEDASETDMVKREEYTGLKEQMYQEKLFNLKKQLQLLKDGLHPEFNRRMRKLDQGYRERLRLNEVAYKYELECVEREYVSEKRASARDFEDKKIELRESLLIDLEDKKKSIEAERLTMEFTGGVLAAGDSMEVKPVTTRKLRRRPNDPAPLPEKRRKTSPAQLNYLLDDCQVIDDLKLINRGYASVIPGKALTVKKPMFDTIRSSVVNQSSSSLKRRVAMAASYRPWAPTKSGFARRPIIPGSESTSSSCRRENS